MELVRRFSPEVLDRGLAAWTWLPDLAGKSVVVTSAFGDVFLDGPDGVWFLDLVEGSLTRRWDDLPALQAELNTPEGQDQLLLGGLVQAAYAAGLVPGEDELLQYKVAPILGGSFGLENIEVISAVVALQIAGQLHEQVKDLPDGTQISGFKIV